MAVQRYTSEDHARTGSGRPSDELTEEEALDAAVFLLHALEMAVADLVELVHERLRFGALHKHREYDEAVELIAALKDKDQEVRGSAASALGRIGPAAKEAVPALEAAARDGVDGAESALKKIRGKQ